MDNNNFKKMQINNKNNKNTINVGKMIATSIFNNFGNFCDKHRINTDNNNNNNSITFFFLLSTGQKYKYSANPNDLFKKVLEEFTSENSFLKNKIECALCNASKVDKNKTLSENGITENSSIVLKVSDTNNMDPFTFNALNANKTILNDSVTNKSTLLSLDKDDIKLLLSIKDLLQKVNENQKKIIKNMENDKKQNKNSDKNQNNNINLCNNKSYCLHIHIKEHEHGLILLFTNRDWICNICLKSYSKEETSYYCSLCDYDVCNGCIGKEKKYPLIPYYHEQTELKSFKFSCHEHKMIYCRTSRNYNKTTSWTCNLCKTSYENKIWSFYCTLCDYDICLKCSKEFISEDLYISNDGIKIDNHNHRLILMITNKCWICNLCHKNFDESDPTFYCTKCDYNVCEKCLRKISDEPKYPLDEEGNRKNDTIETINFEGHKHPLMYCITSRAANKKTNWFCNECSNHFGSNEWSFYCSLCDYDLCYNCYLNNIEKESEQKDDSDEYYNDFDENEDEDDKKDDYDDFDEINDNQDNEDSDNNFGRIRIFRIMVGKFSN